jgi:hypothetical protein
VPPAPPSTPSPRASSYELAFRAWSSPHILPTEEAPSGPLTYQVYAPDELPPIRPRDPSRFIDPPPFARETGIGGRLAMMLVGVCVVVGTTAAIVLASSDDSEGPAVGGQVAPPPLPATEPAAASTITPVIAPMIAIEDVPPEPEPPVAPAAAKAKPVSVSASPPAARPTAASRGAVTPPPNPYAGTPASVLRPPPGYSK